MKITPLDIRQKTFERQIRGYDKEEVSAFLTYLSQEWEKVLDEQKTLQLKFEQADKEAQKLREIEQSLFRTLKTAEDTGASIIEHANKTADEILKEAHMEADLLKSDAKNKAKNLQEQAESKSKDVIEDLKEGVAMLSDAYEQLLNQREILLVNLRNLAQDTLENIRISQENFQQIDLSIPTQQVKQLLEGDNLMAAEEPEEYEPEMELILKPEIPDAERLYTEGDELPGADHEEADSAEEAEAGVPEEAPEHWDREKKPTPSGSTAPKKGNGTGSFFDQFD